MLCQGINSSGSSMDLNATKLMYSTVQEGAKGRERVCERVRECERASVRE